MPATEVELELELESAEKRDKMEAPVEELSEPMGVELLLPALLAPELELVAAPSVECATLGAPLELAATRRKYSLGFKLAPFTGGAENWGGIKATCAKCCCCCCC